MSTDYNKWNKWNELDASEETEKRWEVDDLEDEAVKSAAHLREATAAVHMSTQRSAESLRSKAAVERLKATMGGAGGRARRKNLESVATISEDAVIANDIAQKIEQPEEETAIGRLAGTLGGISIDLADVLSRLNDLKSQTKSRDGAVLSLHGGLSLLQQLSGLGAQCIGLRRGDLWSSPDAEPCQKLMADLERSILSLYADVTAMISVLGLNLGEFAVAADMSRCMLRISQAAEDARQQQRLSAGRAKAGGAARHGEAIMFVVRGLAFLCMGHAHLCHVHLTQAVKLHPKYPGLAALTSRVDEEVQREARSANYRPSELTPYVLSNLQRTIRRARHTGDMITPTRLDRIDVIDMLCNGVSVGQSSTDEALLHMDDIHNSSTIAVEERSDVLECRVCQYVQSVHASHPIDILLMLRKTFYEGQVLYIESLMRSAEIKYMSCVALIRTWLNSASFTAEGNAGKYGEVVALLCAALMNAATCRSARELRPKTYAPLETCVASLLSLLPDVETLCKLPPLALADMALDANRICAKEAGQPYSDIVLSLKKCLLLERNGNMTHVTIQCFKDVEVRLLQALETAKLGTYISSANGASFVCRYPNGQILTQSFMSGSLCNPVDYTTGIYEDSNLAIEDWAHMASTSVPPVSLLEEQIADVRTKLEKLKLKLS